MLLNNLGVLRLIDSSGGYFLRFDKNESPLGASPNVHDFLSNHLASLVTNYPNDNSYLIKAIAKHCNVDPNQIVLGNGSINILCLIPQVFAGPDNDIIFHEYCFKGFRFAAKLIGANTVIVDEDEIETDLKAVANNITRKTKVICIANPGNPIGKYFYLNEMEDFLSNVPADILVIIDEAYYEYAKFNVKNNFCDTLKLQKKHNNLIIVRTFSKAYGLAGLRIGYAIACPEVTQKLNARNTRYNINSMAQVAAKIALNDQEHLKKAVELNYQEKTRMELLFRERGIFCLPSKGNFLTIRLGDKCDFVYKGLIKENILTFSLESYGLNDYLRLSTNLKNNNDVFFHVFDKILRSMC